MKNGNKMTKPIVAHICPSYLPISETFIYRYLVNFKQIKPIVLAGKIENLEQFPLDHIIYDCSYKRFKLRWLINGLANRLIGDYDYYRKIVLKVSGAHIIHAHFGPIGYFALNLKKKLGIPLITTFYGYDVSLQQRQKIWKERYDALFREGDLFLVEGSHMREALINIGCPQEKVKIQHIAIDMNQFKYQERMPKKDGSVKILFCGRFTEKKGLIYALMALNEIVQSYPGIELRVIGDGELRLEIEQYIIENNLDRNVTLLGYQPHYVVAKEMTGSDICIQPSVTAFNGDTEGGAPTILLEAQASGVPVLSSKHADIPEVVVDGKSALLSAERDFKELSQNMIYLIQNQEKWKIFGKEGKKHVERYYDIKKEVVKLETCYLELIKM